MTIELPASDIPAPQFAHRYEQYLLLLKQIEAAKDLDRKLELVAKRKRELEEGLPEKPVEKKDSRPPSGKADQEPGLSKQGSIFKPEAKLSKPKPKRSRAVSHVVSSSKRNSLVETLKKANMEGIEETESDSYDGDSGGSTDRMKANENQLTKLSNNVLKHYDNSVAQIMQPTKHEPVVSEFDRLRKRVNYLTKGKQTALTAEQEAVPWNMQIYQGFLDEDERKKKAMRESRKLEGRAASDNDTDSDESIREIKRKQKKTQVRIDLNNLTDAQIAKLNIR